MCTGQSETITMTGATGFVGTYLNSEFRKLGREVVSLGRRDFALDAIQLAHLMKGTDVAVNLAGAPIIGRWTEAYKKVLHHSRIDVTRKLIDAFDLMPQKPKLFISTSAIGYYAAHGSHTEDHFTRATDFLGQLAHDWEAEALKATDLGIRTIIFRFGVVLGKNGGPLQKMLPPFKLGLGGAIGNGLQPFSWIHINDLCRAYLTVMENASFEGIYNLTSPHPTTNLGLTKALGKVLARPTFFQIPKFILHLRFGEGAQVLTEGQKVYPKRLIESGFDFQFQDIQAALNDCVS